jgi:hypothetical protein
MSNENKIQTDWLHRPASVSPDDARAVYSGGAGFFLSSRQIGDCLPAHEAGHAIVAAARGMTVTAVRVGLDGGGYCHYVTGRRRSTRQKLLDRLVIAVAGDVGVEILAFDKLPPAVADATPAMPAKSWAPTNPPFLPPLDNDPVELCRFFDGLNIELGVGKERWDESVVAEVAAELGLRAKSAEKIGHKIATEILQRNKPALLRLAAALKQRQFLGVEEVKNLIGELR